MAEGKSSSIQVIERMVHLLDIMAAHPHAVSLKVLSSGAQLHPSTAHRILSVLIGHRMVERTEHGMYRLGMRLLELGNLAASRVTARQDGPQHAAAPLPRFSDAAGNPPVRNVES